MTRPTYSGRQTVAHTSWWARDYLHRRPLHRSIKSARKYVTGRVLDVGCGHQVYREWFAADRYVGCDVSTDDSRPEIEADSSALPFASESFDSVVCTQVIEHVVDPRTTLKEIGRVLRPGGHLVLTAPQAWRIHEAPHDYFRYTKFGLAQLAREAGLEVVRVQAQGTVWAHLGQTFLNLLPVDLYRVATPLTFIVNIVFGLLDSIWWETGDTLNWLLVARRNESR